MCMHGAVLRVEHLAMALSQAGGVLKGAALGVFSGYALYFGPHSIHPAIPPLLAGQRLPTNFS